MIPIDFCPSHFTTPKKTSRFRSPLSDHVFCLVLVMNIGDISIAGWWCNQSPSWKVMEFVSWEAWLSHIWIMEKIHSCSKPPIRYSTFAIEIVSFPIKSGGSYYSLKPPSSISSFQPTCRSYAGCPFLNASPNWFMICQDVQLPMA